MPLRLKKINSLFLSLFSLIAFYNVRAQQPKLMLPIGHVGAVRCSQFSPDDRRIATGGEDNTVKVWDVATGLLLLDLKKPDGKILSVQFSPDGKKLLSVHDNGIARIWNSYNGDLLMSIIGEDSVVYSAEFSPDGLKVLTTCEGDSSVRVWDAVTGEVLLKIKGETGVLHTAKYDSAGDKIISICQDTAVKVWDASSGKILLNLKAHKQPILIALFSADNKKILTKSRDTTMKIWDAATGKILADHKVTGNKLSSYNFRFKNIFNGSAEFNGDSRRIVFTTIDYNQAQIWDIQKDSLQQTLVDSGMTSAIFSPDGKCLAITVERSTKILDVSNGELIMTVPDDVSFFQPAQFCNNGTKLASFSLSGSIKIWDISKKKPIAILAGHENYISSVSFSPDGQKILTVDNTSIKVWNILTNKFQINSNRGAGVFSAKYNPEGTKIVLTTDSGISVLDVSTGKLIKKLNLPTIGGEVEFTADGKKFLTSYFLYDSTVTLWDANKYTLLVTLRGHQSRANASKFV